MVVVIFRLYLSPQEEELCINIKGIKSKIIISFLNQTVWGLKVINIKFKGKFEG